MSKVRLEVSTYGIDEALQGFSSDPFVSAGNLAVYTGLRIPPVLPSDTGPMSRPRYLFNLASVKFLSGIRVLGMRQGVTLGMDANLGTPPLRPIEQFVETPTFRFVDGNISWHLMIDRENRVEKKPATDASNWTFLQSTSPSMLYQTFTNTKINPQGAPLEYMVGLTAYSPPAFSQIGDAVAGLGNIHDLRYPWDSASVWRDLGDGGLFIDGGGRLTLYASVLQTNPATRGSPSHTMTNISSSNLPEESFLQDYSVAGPGEVQLGPIYWRIMGALIVETDA